MFNSSYVNGLILGIRKIVYFACILVENTNFAKRKTSNTLSRNPSRLNCLIGSLISQAGARSILTLLAEMRMTWIYDKMRPWFGFDTKGGDYY